MKKIARYISLFVIGSLLFACTEDIILPLDTADSMLIVEGGLTTDTTIHTIYLRMSNGFYENAEVIPVTDAEVRIATDNRTYFLTETVPGTYQTSEDAYALADENYYLSVSTFDENGNEEHFWAESYFAPINPIDSLHVRFFDWVTTDNPFYYVTLFMQENPDAENYYMARLFKNNVLITDTISEIALFDDTYLNGRYIDGSVPFFLLDSEKEDELLTDGDTLTVWLYGISKVYYQFLDDVTSTNASNPFMGSPANVRSNIQPSDKASGFFHAAMITRKSVVFREE